LNNIITGTNTNTINGPSTVNGNTQINGTLGSTGNLSLGTASTTNVYGASGSANRFNGTSNFGTLPASDGNKLIIDGVANTTSLAGPSGTPGGTAFPSVGNNFEMVDNGDFQVTGWSKLHTATIDELWITTSIMFPPTATICVQTVQTQNLASWCSTPGAPINMLTNISGGNIWNISNLLNLQAGTVTIGTSVPTQTTLTSTNATGAAMSQQLASVAGKIPVYLRQALQLTGVGGGPNGGAVTPNFTFGANGFDNNDAITVTYMTRNGVQFGSIYPVNINTAAGTLQVESTNPLDVNTVQVTILRD
jgi:hypothetical protein